MRQKLLHLCAASSWTGGRNWPEVKPYYQEFIEESVQLVWMALTKPIYREHCSFCFCVWPDFNIHPVPLCCGQLSRLRSCISSVCLLSMTQQWRQNFWKKKNVSVLLYCGSPDKDGVLMACFAELLTNSICKWPFMSSCHILYNCWLVPSFFLYGFALMSVYMENSLPERAWGINIYTFPHKNYVVKFSPRMTSERLNYSRGKEYELEKSMFKMRFGHEDSSGLNENSPAASYRD